MMKYDNGSDWVEIGAGIAKRPMRELVMLDADIESAHALAVKHTTDAHFTDADGKVVDWKADILGLTVQQWNWWKGRLWAAARDEKLDPEA